MESVELIFAHTEQEYLAAVKSLYWNAKEPLWRLLIFFIFSSISIVGLAFLVGITLPLWAMFGLVVVVAVGGYHGMVIDVPRRAFRGDPKFREEFRIVFSDRGIEFETKSIKASYGWNLYTKVIDNKTFYLLIYGKALSQMTIVPKRAFRDSFQEVRFRELVRRHITEATPVQQIKQAEYVPSSLEPPDWR